MNENPEQTAIAESEDALNAVDTAQLHRVLAAANPNVLAAVLCHLTGGAVVLPAGERSIEAARRELPRWVTGDRVLPPVDDAVVAQALELCAGGPVPIEYVGLAKDQMALAPKQPQPRVSDVPEDFKVLVVGAGMSGICAAIALARAGIEHEIVDANPQIGGTWLVNTYPGCGVDTANFLYSYSFEPNPKWTRYYCEQPEVLDYLRHVADKHGIPQRTRFGTTVERLVWVHEDQQWQAEMSGPGTARSSERFGAVIAAMGILNQPKMPELAGAEEFRGLFFHSARWPADFDPASLRVAVVGTGASANQIVPAIADAAKHVYVFQRSAPWMSPHPDTFRSLPGDERWLFQHLPGYLNYYRFMLFWSKGDGIYPTLRKDPDWAFPERSVSAGNDRTREQLTSHITAVVGDRPELLAKVIPSYPPYGKRMLLDHMWYETLCRDDVELITDPIERVDADGIRCGGRHVELDAIVAATGFRPDKVLWPMEVIGPEGIDVQEQFGDNPQGFMGVSVAGYPNLWTIFGPNSNLAHGGSAYFVTECQVHYIMECFRLMFARGSRTMEVRRDVQDEYNRIVDATLEDFVWTHPGVHSWYKNSQGRVTTNLPWRLVDYWTRTRQPEADNYVFG